MLTIDHPAGLPLHPTMRHPHTGAPLRALYVRRNGQPCWPILGAADAPPDDGGTGGDSGSGSAADKAGDKNDTCSAASNGKTDDLGFPANTPTAEMNDAQRAAYWQHQARKHQDRNAALLKITGGKHGDDLKADIDELTKLRTASMSAAEKAVADAKNEGKTEATAALSADAARVALEFALGHDPEKNDQSTLIDTLDLSKLVGDDGKVDTAKVRTLAATLAPSVKGTGNSGAANYGGGSRGGTTSTGVEAGRSRYQERHGKADKANA